MLDLQNSPWLVAGLVCGVLIFIALLAALFIWCSGRGIARLTGNLLGNWQSFAAQHNLKFDPAPGEVSGEYKGYPVHATGIPLHSFERRAQVDPQSQFATLVTLTLPHIPAGSFTLSLRDTTETPPERIKTGDLAFDMRFTLKGDPAEWVQQLFNQNQLRQILLQNPAAFTLKLKQDTLIYHQPGLASRAEDLHYLLDALVQLAESLKPAPVEDTTP